VLGRGRGWRLLILEKEGGCRSWRRRARGFRCSTGRRARWPVGKKQR
jgi:hypothetical protein